MRERKKTDMLATCESKKKIAHVNLKKKKIERERGREKEGGGGGGGVVVGNQNRVSRKKKIGRKMDKLSTFVAKREV